VKKELELLIKEIQLLRKDIEILKLKQTTEYVPYPQYPIYPQYPTLPGPFWVATGDSTDATKIEFT
jgi:hypothetical protein